MDILADLNPAQKEAVEAIEARSLFWPAPVPARPALLPSG